MTAEPNVLVISVRESPRPDATVLGTIVVIATPSEGLRAYSASVGVARPFVPDLFDGDWGYGPYFHQTVRASLGPWPQIPIDGVSNAGWVDTRQWTDEPDVVPVAGIVTTPRGSMVVLGTENGELIVRPEQPSDMWREATDPPAEQPWEPIRIPFDELFDANGHLLVHVQYTRGC